MQLLEMLPDDSVDLIIAHPPCTALAVSGNAWYGQGMAKHQRDSRRCAGRSSCGIFASAKGSALP